MRPTTILRETGTITGFSGCDVAIFKGSKNIGEMQAITWVPTPVGIAGSCVACYLEESLDSDNLSLRIRQPATDPYDGSYREYWIQNFEILENNIGIHRALGYKADQLQLLEIQL